MESHLEHNGRADGRRTGKPVKRMETKRRTGACAGGYENRGAISRTTTSTSGHRQYTILLTSHYSIDKLHTDDRAYGLDSTLFILLVTNNSA
ncbi:hypothetical protein ALC57_00525 [Trachymyrmex cornetzi]|uniref:Uncharacterized protein n=1 Tax=Trachymyrmex cornetzi TaxID=471704 RepID=A0A151JS03_9HYME|nr:hypothetical protein ALC57_00525 [Trachymyrmex cornetzi]